MPIFKFTPWLRTMVWGGALIAPYKGIVTDQEKIGESWEISAFKGHETVVSEGEYAGMTITELVSLKKGELVGEKVYAEYGDKFPLLIKFIDARADLSIQVHPDDEMAARVHGDKGKTEMWYVVDAEEGASLYSGLSEAITPEEYEQRIADSSITDVLARFQVKEGDVFFLPAGRIHAICSGCFIAEIQQTSDLTYRIYDYGRLGLDGKPRELHTELAKQAIDYKVYDDYKTDYVSKPNEENVIVKCHYFTTSLYELTEPVTKDLSALDSFVVVMCVRGEGTLCLPGEAPVAVRQGETVLVPANAAALTVTPSGDVPMKVLTSCIE